MKAVVERILDARRWWVLLFQGVKVAVIGGQMKGLMFDINARGVVDIDVLGHKGQRIRGG